MRLLMKYLVNLVTRDKLIEVKAPVGIEVTLFQQEKRFIVHLINFHCQRVPQGRNVVPIMYAEEIPPVYNIEVKLKVPFEVKKVMLQPQGKKLKFKKKGNRIAFVVPQVHIHAMAVIEV